MRKVLFAFVFFTQLINAQVAIPDPVFKSYLLAATGVNAAHENVAIDADGNGEIESEEASRIFQLIISNSGITDLTGISAFTNLESLDLIDVSTTSFTSDGLTRLAVFYVKGTLIQTLDLSPSIAMIRLDAESNSNLTHVNLSGLSQLNYITTKLNSLLTTMNITGLSSLEYFYTDRDNFHEFDFSQTPALKGFDSFRTPMRSVDFSMCHNLLNVSVFEGQLTYANLKNGNTENNIQLELNPDLHFVCVDDNDRRLFVPPTFGDFEMNSYCSFAPGGNYNTITGKVLFDAEQNGCNESDAAQSFLKIKIDDGTTQGAAFTNEFGDYRFYTTAGNFVLQPDLQNTNFFTSVSQTVSFPTANSMTEIRNFCVFPIGIHPDVEIVIAPIAPARPGFDAVYKIVYKNNGNQTLSGNIAINFDDSVLDFISGSIGVIPTAGSLAYQYAALRPFESREIVVVFSANAPTATPPLNINDILEFSASITPLADETPEDNLFVLSQVVVGSFDPNDKQCIEGETVSEDHIGKYLHYIINFENTGTHVAENVVVKDTINTAQFDINSLQILNASPGVKIKVTGNVVEFIFEGIHLPIGGHGNVLFKIKTKDNLPIHTEVSNVANIYFDYNIPIITNHATTRFSSLGARSFTTDDSVSVYPNPSTDIVNIRAMHDIKSVSLYDFQGRLLDVKYASSKQVQLNLAQKRAGFYLVQVVTDKGAKAEKLIKK